MRAGCVILVAAVALAFSGCSAVPRLSSTFESEPPTQHHFENERYFDRPFEEVWDELVEELAKGFFVINNIEKASRIINVSFSIADPGDYVDCGRSHRTFASGKTTENYDYDISASCVYKIGRNVELSAVTNTMRRETDLEGRVNIYVAPKGEGTLVTVNARYVFKTTASGIYEVQAPLATHRGTVNPTSATVNFDTANPGSTIIGDVDDPFTLTCVSTGKLELEILGMAE